MRRLGWILVAGAVARIGLQAVWQPTLAADAADYDRLARALLDGEGFVDTRGSPTSFRPPLYPAFVAFWYALAGPGTRWIGWAQVALDLTTVWITYQLARHWLAERWALWAAGLTAANLALISATGRLLSESLFTALLMAAVWLASLAWREPARTRPGVAALAGSVFGFAVLTRGVLLPFVFLIVLAAAVAHRRLPRGTVPFVMAFLVVLTPWTLRNLRVHDAFVPVTTQVGITLYAGFAPPGGVFGLQPSDSVVQAVQHLSEPEQSAALVRASLRTALSDPVATLALEARKAVYFWSPVDWEILPRYGTFNPTYAWTVVLAALFLWLGYQGGPRRRDLWPVWLPVAFLFAMALVFHGSPRYRLPAEPFLAVLAAAGVRAAVRRWGGAGATRRLLTLAALCVVATAASDPLRTWVGSWVR